MDLLTIVRLIAVVCAGLVAGGYLIYRGGVYHALRELSASGFVQFHQAMHVHLVKFVPLLVLGDVLGVLVWLVMLRSQWRSVGFWLVAAATCGNVLILAMTSAVMFR